MIKSILLYLSSVFFITAQAQLLLPNFEQPIKIATINSEWEESSTIPYNNGQNLYFVRTAVGAKMKERSKGQEVWQTKRNDENWETPINVFEAVNDNANNAIIGASADGNRIYVFNSIQSRRKLAKGIALTEKNENGEWSDLKRINIPGFKIGDGLYSFYINPEETILLISTAPKGDTTEYEDLFVTLKDSLGKWQPIINLGNTINTPKSELSPYLAKDNKTLYFSSTGHKGLGDADVFVSYRMDDSWTNWTKPANMGTPINSEAFDAYFIIGNNQEVFFTSNRNQVYSDIFFTKITRSARFASESKIVDGKFIYNELPTEGVKLKIYDENDSLIDEVITDKNGLFSYNKLTADGRYLIKLSEEDESKYNGAIIYLLDENGEPRKRLQYLSGSKSFMEEEQALDPNDLFTAIFEYKNLPQANSGLVLLNENGVIIDTIYTDSNGKFQYDKLKFDQATSFKPLGSNNDDFSNYAIYLDGENRKKLSLLSADNNSLELKNIADESEVINGIFEYKKLPQANSGLVIWDENGFAVDTLYTDEYGKFTFKKIKPDVLYSIRPLDLTTDDLDDAIIYILDDNDKKIGKSDNNNSAFLLLPYTEDDKEIAKVKDKVDLPINMDNKGDYTLDYPFNQYYLGRDDKQTLLKVISILRKDKSLSVTLIGHTDNVGREHVNQEISLQRAELAKTYMTERRVANDRITTEGVADKRPIATNETKEGRAANRRVEIYIK